MSTFHPSSLQELERQEPLVVRLFANIVSSCFDGGSVSVDADSFVDPPFDDLMDQLQQLQTADESETCLRQPKNYSISSESESF